MFMIVALFIAISPSGERQDLLGFVTDACGLAILVFNRGFGKIFVWRREVARVVTSGLAPTAPQEAGSEENGHMSSH